MSWRPLRPAALLHLPSCSSPSPSSTNPPEMDQAIPLVQSSCGWLLVSTYLYTAYVVLSLPTSSPFSGVIAIYRPPLFLLPLWNLVIPRKLEPSFSHHEQNNWLLEEAWALTWFVRCVSGTLGTGLHFTIVLNVAEYAQHKMYHGN